MDTYIINQHYDEDIISKIKEMIESGLNKLKSIVKSKTKPKLDFYNELKFEFNDISSKLDSLELYEECKYFLAIEDMVLYIVRQNYIDNHFGYCNFAVELLDFFIFLFNTNLMFYQNNGSFSDEEFKLHQKSYKNQYHEYRRMFYQDIYEPSGRFTENELYEILKGWKR